MSSVDTLISAIFINRALWDSSDVNHHNSFVVDKLWEQVAAALRMRKRDVQAKWKQLRDTFQSEVRKISAPKSGNRGGQGMQVEDGLLGGNRAFHTSSDWPYFDKLKFLANHSAPHGNGGNVSSSVVAGSSLDADTDVFVDKATPQSPASSMSATGQSGTLQIQQCSCNVENRLTELSERSKLSTEGGDLTPRTNMFITFCYSLVPHVDKLKDNNKMLCMMDVQQVVYRHVYGELNGSATSPDVSLDCKPPNSDPPTAVPRGSSISDRICASSSSVATGSALVGSEQAGCVTTTLQDPVVAKAESCIQTIKLEDEGSVWWPQEQKEFIPNVDESVSVRSSEGDVKDSRTGQSEVVLDSRAETNTVPFPEGATRAGRQLWSSTGGTNTCSIPERVCSPDTRTHAELPCTTEHCNVGVDPHTNGNTQVGSPHLGSKPRKRFERATRSKTNKCPPKGHEASTECFTGLDSVTKQSTSHSGQEQYSCTMCSKAFVSIHGLQQHFCLSDSKVPVVSNVNRNPVCSRSSLRERAHQPVGESPYACDVSGKADPLRTSLLPQKFSHTAAKHFTCDVCKKSFTLKCNLRAHMSLHTGEKPFLCHICNKSFRLKYVLQWHIRIHKGERPFTCDICGKSFTAKGDLTVHMRIHTGEKSYSCDICNRQFRVKKNLAQHMRVHTGEKPFTCAICGKCFSEKQNLKRHNRTHVV